MWTADRLLEIVGQRITTCEIGRCSASSSVSSTRVEMMPFSLSPVCLISGSALACRTMLLTSMTNIMNCKNLRISKSFEYYHIPLLAGLSQNIIDTCDLCQDVTHLLESYIRQLC